MKTSRAIIIAALCLAAVSCTKDIRIFNPKKTAAPTSDKITMAVAPVVFGDYDTKTEASVDELSGLSFTWSEKDTVGVYSPDGGFSRFTLAGEGGTTHAWFTGQGFSLTAGNSYSALYPYDGGKSNPEAVHISYIDRKVSGPDKIEDVLPFDPLYATAEASGLGGADFQFRHLSAFARFTATFPVKGSFNSLELMPMYDVIPDEGDLNIQTGAWTAGGGRNITAVPLSNISASPGQQIKMWLPFAPQDFRGNDIAALMRDKDTLYTARLKGKNFESGKAYRWDNELVRYTQNGKATVSLTEKDTKAVYLSGQFSAINYIGDNTYAVVHDNLKGGGIVYLKFTIDNYGNIGSVTEEVPAGTTNGGAKRECEGIAYVPSSKTLFVSAEGDQRILEYDMDGYPTGRELSVPNDMSTKYSVGNAGFESLGYNANTGLFWTTTENDIKRDNGFDSNGRFLMRLQSFRDTDLAPGERFLYLTDKPQKDKGSANIYAFGISDILALDNGKLLVMEREAYIPDGNVVVIEFGTVVYIKIYEVDPVNDKGGILSKRLVKSFTYNAATSFANYEGIGFGPVIGGKQSVVMISDSQENYKSILPDYIKVLFLN